MTTTKPAIKLFCPECHQANDPQRIYCHDCGAKLDRTTLAKVKSKAEDPKATRRRVKAMFDPGHAMLKHRLFQGAKLLLAALFAAAVAQMVRPPDVPERPKASMFPVPISMDLENAVTSVRVGTQVAPLQYTDEQVNTYLASALKSKQGALSKYLKFERGIFAFEEGYSRLTIERSLYGVSVFTTASFEAKVQEGKILVTTRGLQIGRMPIHPAVIQYAGVLFDDVLGALERERKLIVKLESIEFHPHLIIFVPRASQAAVPQT